MKAMTWSNEIAGAYSLGLEDGRGGNFPRMDQVYAAAYAQGYLHGENERRWQIMDQRAYSRAFLGLAAEGKA
jgi:hypothetical protein